LLEISFGESPTKPGAEIRSEPVDQLAAILGAVRTPLLILDKATPDLPVSRCHEEIDRASRRSPSLLQKLNDVAKNIAVTGQLHPFGEI